MTKIVNILDYAHLKDDKPRLRDGETSQLLLFTGVRIERPETQDDDPHQSGTRRRSRKIRR